MGEVRDYILQKKSSSPMVSLESTLQSLVTNGYENHNYMIFMYRVHT